jgi:hypothetical protein
VTERGLDMTGRVRSVVAAVWRGTLGLHTGASSRSGTGAFDEAPRETAKHVKSIGRGGASGHDRPDASGREWVLTGNDQTLALWRPAVQAVHPVAWSAMRISGDWTLRCV